MRELVYLSDRKLSEFRQERRRGFRVREIGVPGVGQVGIEQHADSHLDDVIDHLSGIARWYQEDGLAAGEWVQFEATMSYTVLAPQDIPAVLIFADAPSGRRLILHGAPQHLIGAPVPPVTELPMLWLSRHNALPMLIDAVQGRPRRTARVGDLTAVVGEVFDPDTAVPMAGYARITTTAFGEVVASPLFVAYARQ